MEWTTIVRTAGENPDRSAPTGGGRNMSGLVVKVTDGEVEHEVGRVLFARQNSRRPEVPFEEALAEEVEKAETACVALNELMDEYDRVRAQAEDAAREKVRELVEPLRERSPA